MGGAMAIDLQLRDKVRVAFVNTHILLLRGVNVSGANIVKMAEFRAFLSGVGLSDVETYIQSGNAVFASKSRRWKYTL